MSHWFEIFSIIMQAQAGAGAADALQTCKSQGGICPATAFNSITAAFATQGYFMQADMLYYITGTGFGIWAPFIYLIAAAGGIISLAMGMPPKMYVWFFVGPGVFHWLVETRAPAHGVQWQVAQVLQDQRPVWRLAHVGLLNSNIVARMGPGGAGADTRYELKDEIKQTSWCKPAPDPVYVSNFFLWFDQLISYTIQRIVDMTGITKTNAQAVSSGGSKGVLEYSGTGDNKNNWYLMSEKKWVLLDTITSARINNANLRDAFVSFLSSECGDGLSRAIDNTNFVTAANSASGQMPCTVMQHTNTDAMRKATRDNNMCVISQESFAPAFLDDEYEKLSVALTRGAVPLSESMRRLFEDDSIGSFVHFLNGSSASSNGTGSRIAKYFQSQDAVECQMSFYALVQAFRWEAGHIYNQLIQSGPVGLKSDLVLYNLFYGWGVRKFVGGDLLTAEEMKDWTRNLILVHLLRNELAVAPRVADKKFSNEATLDSFSQNYVAQTGSKAKYGEVYSWARMVPYIQGILLYLLAMGYPFACIMIVMPGWHKTLFTWMSFWVWVKMWDAGFAVVTVAERSIWSMLGNSTKLNFTSPLINQMTEWGQTKFEDCSASGSTTKLSECFADMQASLQQCTTVPNFYDSVTGGIPWWHTAAIFDRALMLGSSMDIDVANGYYIYLMSALYFAVPAATGQLILGAKAGVAGMANTLMQGAQQDGGRGASSGFLGNMRGQIAGGAAAMRQESHAKALRKGGLAEQSLAQGNKSLEAGLNSGALDAANRQMGLRSTNLGIGQGIVGARIATAQSRTSADAAMAFSLSTSLGKSAGAFHNAASGGLRGDLTALSMVVPGDSQNHLSGSLPRESEAAPVDANPVQPSGAGEKVGNIGAAAYGKLAFMQNASGMAQNAMSPTLNARAAIATAGYEQQKLNMASEIGGEQAGLNADQANRNLSAFGYSSQREALGIGEKRYGAQADFAAQTAVHGSNVGLSDHAAGYIGSLGGDASVVNPSAKPTDMTGFAMSGRLGMATQSSAGFAMNGFQTQRAQASSILQSNYGSSYVNGGFSTWVDSPNTTVGGARRAASAYGNQIVDNSGSVPSAPKGNR